MFYRDLPQVFGPDPFYKAEEGISTLRDKYGIEAPEQIFKQIYCGLTSNPEFISMYGHLNIKSLKWDLISLPAAAFAELERNATFPDHMLAISEDYKNYAAQFTIDAREDVAEHWEKHGTWKEPPMFIERSILSPNERGLHLVEGHTRVGTLLGATKYGFVKLAETHQVYLATHI